VTEEESAGPLGRRERKKAEVRRRIQRSALELFQEKGYEATTVEEIAERADVGKGTFFNYFARKDALLAALGEEFFEEIGAELGAPERWEGTAREQFQRLFFAMARAVEQDRALSKVMLIENMRNFWLRTADDPLEQAFRRLTTTVLNRGVERGEFAGGLDVEVAARLLEAAYFTTMVEWLREGAPGAVFRAQLTAKLDILFRGFGADVRDT
jgi:TetR/AcrR family transcriptional regulator, cholesterol catabolism regulator